MKYEYYLLPIALLALAGCAVGPDYERPAMDIPAAYVSQRPEGGAAVADGAEWWAGFNDQTMLDLIHDATTNNLTVRQAVQRVERSRASLQETNASFWPEVGFSAGATKSKGWNPDKSDTRANVGFDASWEIDLFGGLRRASQAATAELAATELSLEDARLSLEAEIAAEYVNLRLSQTKLAIARENLAARQDFLKIAKAKFEAGLANERDAISAEAQLKSIEASIPSLAASISQTKRRIELLCGRNPGTLDAVLSADAAIPVAPATPDTLPSDVLRLRPDVRKAEQTYIAAVARIGQAIANCYPSVSIGASAGLSSESLSDWADAVKTVSVGPSVRWNILTFGRNKARVRQARAAAEEAALAYSQSVLEALHEVENSINNLREETARAEPVGEAEKLHRRALEISQDMYENDLGEYQDVITAQQSALSAQEGAATQKAQCALDAIALYKAAPAK